MKHSMTLMLAGLALTTGICRAQVEELDMLEEVPTGPELWWSAAASFQHYSDQHDALQVRSDYQYDSSRDWEEGNADGNGWGLEFSVGRDPGQAYFRYYRFDTDFRLVEPNMVHDIHSNGQDVRIGWKQQAGANDSGIWGWNVAARWMGIEKEVDLVEGRDHLNLFDDNEWMMASAGSFGEWRPLTGWLSAHGDVNLLFGEVRGISRTGNDEDNSDGNIQEIYEQAYSLAYGANFQFGIAADIWKYVSVGISYSREWLYSFDTTTTGIVVFPDNDDALFTESRHVWTGYIKGTF